MKLKLRQILAIAVVSIVVIALGMLSVVYTRVIDLRDSQAELILALKQSGETSAVLERGRSGLEAGGVLRDAWWRKVEAVILPFECCLVELQQLMASEAAEVSSTQVLQQIDVFEQAWQRALDEAIVHVAALQASNAPLPFLVAFSIALMFVILWSLLNRGVLIPIERLAQSVGAPSAGVLFTSSLNKGSATEVTMLAEAFDGVVSRLETDIQRREVDLAAAREAARREESARADEYAELIDGSSSPIFSVDSLGVITSWNRQIARLTGLAPGTAIGKVFDRAFLDGASRVGFGDSVKTAMSGSAVHGAEVSIVTGAGTTMRLLLNLSPRRAFDGSIPGVTCFGYEVEEFLNSTAKVFERQQTTYFNDLATGAAHQLAQPLQKMRLYLANAQNRLRRPEVDKAVLSEKLSGVDVELSRMGEIIDHLRLFGKKTPPVEGGFSLATVIDRCAELVGGRLTEQGISLEVSNELGSEHVFGHPLQVEKCLVAIFDNATEALETARPAKPMITVSANINAQANSADISIKDNGGGVDVADLGKVFDPFFTTKMSGKNVGLGLASSRALIEEIGGDVTLRSSDNETIVKISLPLILPPSSTGVVL